MGSITYPDIFYTACPFYISYNISFSHFFAVRFVVEKVNEWLALFAHQLIVHCYYASYPNCKGETLFLFRQNLVSAKIGLV